MHIKSFPCLCINTWKFSLLFSTQTLIQIWSGGISWISAVTSWTNCNNYKLCLVHLVSVTTLYDEIFLKKTSSHLSLTYLLSTLANCTTSMQWFAKSYKKTNSILECFDILWPCPYFQEAYTHTMFAFFLACSCLQSRWDIFAGWYSCWSCSLESYTMCPRCKIYSIHVSPT